MVLQTKIQLKDETETETEQKKAKGRRKTLNLNAHRSFRFEFFNNSLKFQNFLFRFLMEKENQKHRIGTLKNPRYR